MTRTQGEIVHAAIAEVGYAFPGDNTLAMQKTPPEVVLKAFNLARLAHGKGPFDSPSDVVRSAVRAFEAAGNLFAAGAWRRYATRWDIDWEASE